LLCLAFICFDGKEWKGAEQFFKDAYQVAKETNETSIAEQCLCNAGIASGNG